MAIKLERQRVKWCNRRLLRCLDEQEKTLFSEESVFCVTYEYQGLRVRQMKQKHLTRLYEVICETCKQCKGKVCMNADNPKNLCILTIRFSSDNSEIIKKCLNISQCHRRKFCMLTIPFQYDSAPLHMSLFTKNCLRQYKINVFLCTDNLPYLNPLES